MPLALIESVKIGKRSEEAPRAHISLSFSLDELDRNMLFDLERQVKNAVVVDFHDFQLSLANRPAEGGVDAPVHRYVPNFEENDLRCQFCGEPEGAAIHNYQAPLPPESTTMAVDGQEAVVMREPLSEAAQRLVDGARADQPHPHQPNGTDDKCKLCGLPLMAEIHGPADMVRHFFGATGDLEGDPTPEDVCGLCGKPRSDEIHISDQEADARVANGARNRRRAGA